MGIKTIDWTFQHNSERRVIITTQITITEKDVKEALASTGIFLNDILYKVPRERLLSIQACSGYGLVFITFEQENG